MKIKKKVLVAVSSWILCVGTLTAGFIAPNSTAFAASLLGTPCAKLATFSQTPQGLLVCDLVKKKKVWRKSTSAEVALFKAEQARIQAEAKRKIEDAAKLEADRLAAEAQAAADAAAKAAITLKFEGLPVEMVAGTSYKFNVRGLAQDPCSVAIVYPNGQTQNVNFTISNSGLSALTAQVGNVAGAFSMTASCRQSGVASARIPVLAAAPSNTIQATPAPTKATITRYTQVCIEGNVPQTLIKVGCQTTYPYWNLDFCFNRLQSLAFSLYLDNYTGTQYQSLTTGLRDKSSGIDSPSLCADAAKPLHFTLGDMIPSQVAYPAPFRAVYRLTFAYIVSGNVQRNEYTFAVTLK